MAMTNSARMVFEALYIELGGKIWETDLPSGEVETINFQMEMLKAEFEKSSGIVIHSITVTYKATQQVFPGNYHQSMSEVPLMGQSLPLGIPQVEDMGHTHQVSPQQSNLISSTTVADVSFEYCVHSNKEVTDGNSEKPV